MTDSKSTAETTPYHGVALVELPAAFRNRANELGALVMPQVLNALRECADALDAALAEHGDMLLSVAEAADEWGWSYEGMRRKIVATPGLNAGHPGAPQIHRHDLPRVGPRKTRHRRSDPRVRRAAGTGAGDRSSVFRQIIHEAS